jgi:TetR/AcrR family transcriptional regulator
MRAKPGRPSLQQSLEARDNILKSACLNYARHGVKGSSHRQIARDAKVTPALVHYYFGKKEELYLAVMQTAFDPALAALQTVKTLEDWVYAMHAHLSARPWLPHLMIREVLPQNGLLRALFLQRFAPTMFGAVKALVAKEAKALKARRSLDVDRHVVLLMGMLVYPFLAMGVAENLIGRRFDSKMFEGFRDDALSLFRKGISGTKGT